MKSRLCPAGEPPMDGVRSRVDGQNDERPDEALLAISAGGKSYLSG
jgi:hypothetical protein